MKIKCVELWLVEGIVLFYLGIEPFQRLEKKPLVRFVQRLAEVKILQLITASWARRQTGSQQEPDR